MTTCVPTLLRHLAVVLTAALWLNGSAWAQVGAPSPPHNATGVSVATTLSWGADPKANRYDVYFGTTNPPQLAVRNTSATTYQPAALAPSTLYYWRIDSRGPRGYSATGPVWSFTTAAPAPPPPSIPTGASPASGATGVSTSATLSWSASSNATSYDVAVGSSNPPPLVSISQTATSYQPATLAGGQVYYWQITAKGTGGSTVGPIWTFTTAQPPPPPSTSRDRLRLLTWNVQSSRDAAGNPAVDAQVELMASLGADVIALQEVTITSEYGDLTALYKSKLETLTGVPWYQVWAPAPRAATYPSEGNVLLTRIPILTAATTRFDTTPEDPALLDAKRSAAALTIVVNDIPVTLMTTQLPLDPTQRQRHLDLLQDWSASFQAPRAIGGDFNMLPGDAVYTDMAGTFADVWPSLAGNTEAGFTEDVRGVAPFQPGRVDFWFDERTNAQAQATEISVVKTTRSDHHAVIVDLEVK